MSYDSEFADPVQPGMFKPEEWNQHLLLIEAQQFGETTTRYGPAGYVEARVHILSAPGGVQVIEQARLFGAFEGATRSEIGLRPVIGRVESFVSQQSGRTGYRLGDASPQDREAASGYWAQWKAQHAFAQPAAPTPNSQSRPPAPQSYGPPSAQDQQWATQQVYAPPGVTTNVVPSTAQPQYATAYAPTSDTTPNAPTPAPQPPAPAPAQATPPVPVTPAGPVAQAGAQPPASSVPEMDDEQFAGMPEDVQKLLDAARYARLHGGQ